MSSEKGNRCFLPPLPSRLKQAFTRDLWHPLTSVPLPVRSSPFDQRRIAPISQETLWERGVAWLRYYAIQWRWDIERTMARILHRRWGT